jgi:hypothetical protein
VHASTWVSAGLGVALGGFGGRGGLGSLVVSLVGAWGACGGPGERRGDGVRVFSAYAQHDIHEAPPRNQIESPGGFLRLQVQESRRRKLAVPLADTTGRNLGLKITTQCNLECRRLAPHNSNPAPISRGFDLRPCTPAPLSWQRTRTQRAARFTSHPTGDIGFEQPARQEEDDQYMTKLDLVRAKCACYL